MDRYTPEPLSPGPETPQRFDSHQHHPRHSSATVKSVAGLDRSSLYAKGGIDTINVIRSKLDDEAFEGFVFGMVEKRLHKALFFGSRSTDRKRNLLTAAWYLQTLLAMNYSDTQDDTDEIHNMTRQLGSFSTHDGSRPLGFS